MTDPKRVTEEWKELRPLLGTFVSHLDNCMMECGSAKEAYDDGFKKGYDRGKKEPVYCVTCRQKDWWDQTHNERAAQLITNFNKLKPESQMLVLSIAERLREIEQTINHAQSMLNSARF